MTEPPDKSITDQYDKIEKRLLWLHQHKTNNFPELDDLDAPGRHKRLREIREDLSNIKDTFELWLQDPDLPLDRGDIQLLLHMIPALEAPLDNELLQRQTRPLAPDSLLPWEPSQPASEPRVQDDGIDWKLYVNEEYLDDEVADDAATATASVAVETESATDNTQALTGNPNGRLGDFKHSLRGGGLPSPSSNPSKGGTTAGSSLRNFEHSGGLLSPTPSPSEGGMTAGGGLRVPAYGGGHSQFRDDGKFRSIKWAYEDTLSFSDVGLRQAGGERDRSRVHSQSAGPSSWSSTISDASDGVSNHFGPQRFQTAQNGPKAGYRLTTSALRSRGSSTPFKQSGLRAGYTQNGLTAGHRPNGTPSRSRGSSTPFKQSGLRASYAQNGPTAGHQPNGGYEPNGYMPSGPVQYPRSAPYGFPGGYAQNVRWNRRRRHLMGIQSDINPRAIWPTVQVEMEKPPQQVMLIQSAVHRMGICPTVQFEVQRHL
ncbi:Uu.00g027210.m01.CDS01 [Anthostomella pinea]|uniref:Uu.00g027210.m01.CDS01 n=1 Tax=Anthostomella pinea TaxID=933095 RepID=A0AAI8V2V6_9PEZI|nr:Uu.00g027210.m01.CDS01 [Anthostomella pinea]